MELKSLPEWITYYAKLSPEKVCIVCENRFYTYRTIDMLTSSIANMLSHKGIKPGDSIGLYASRSELVPILILSILKARGVCVPIKEDNPVDRIRLICKDSNIKGIVCDDNVPNVTFTDVWTLRLSIKSFASVLKSYISKPDKSKLTYPKMQDKMFVLYTSGSTGTPKGVVHTHESVMTSFTTEIESLKLEQNDKVLLHTHWSMCFGLTSLESYLVGATLYIATDKQCFDLTLLNQYVEEKEITVLHMPTLVGYQYSLLFQPVSLRLVILGGSSFPKNNNRHSYSIVNIYGSTEAMCLSYCYYKPETKAFSLGKPYRQIEWSIKDPNGKDVSKGTTGILWVKGKSIALGYQNLSEQNKARFRKEEEYRWFNTLDIVREEKDGSFTYIGRSDRMLKIRGMRIDPSEIEFLLSQIEGINQSCVLANNFGNTDFLCAYYVTQAPFLKDGNELKKYLRSHLPEYMIPSVYIHMDEFPLTLNGKIDYSKLPKPSLNLHNDDTFKSPKENLLTSTVSYVLQLKGFISANSRFMEIGGDSLSAMIVISRIRMFGYVISMENLKEMTLKEIALRMEKQKNNVRPYYDGKNIQLTSLCKYIIKNNRENIINNFIIEDFLKPHTRISKIILENVIHMLFESHPILNSFVNENHLVERHAGIYDYRSIVKEIESDYSKEGLGSLIQSFYGSFELKKHLFRILLIHLKHSDLLILGCHHVISDGVSKRILLKDFCRYYSLVSKGLNVSTVKESQSYAEYRQLLKEIYQKQSMSTEVAYWDNIRRNLPIIRMRRIQEKDKFSIISTILPRVESERILLKGRKYNNGILSLALHVLACNVISRFKKNKIACQIIMHGRIDEVKDSYGNIVCSKMFSVDSSIGFFAINPPILLTKTEAKDVYVCDKKITDMPNGGIGFDTSGGYKDVENPTFGIDFLGKEELLVQDDDYVDLFEKYDGIPHWYPISNELDMGCQYLIFLSVRDKKNQIQSRYNTAFFCPEDAVCFLDEFAKRLIELD